MILRRVIAINTKIVGIILTLLFLCSLSGCAFFHKMFSSEVPQQRLKLKRESSTKLYKQSLYSRYKSATVLQTDLTKAVTKRSYILPNGERYRGK